MCAKHFWVLAPIMPLRRDCDIGIGTHIPQWSEPGTGIPSTKQPSQ